MLKRVISSLIGFPIVVLFLLWGNQYALDLVFSIIAIMCLTEFFGTFKNTEIKPIKWIAYLIAAGIAFLHVIPAEYLNLYLMATIPVVIISLFLHIIITEMKTNIIDIAVTALGIFYIVGFIMFIPFIRNLKNGYSYIWYIIFASWGTDVFAYCIGMAIGKHKFTKISPKKSIEGCIGGIIGCTVICLIYTYYLNNNIGLNLNYIYIGIMSVILSIVSQLGDLSASSIKRYNNVKDFGNLIPGHGGLLDRIDSMIFIAPIVYFMFVL